MIGKVLNLAARAFRKPLAASKSTYSTDKKHKATNGKPDDFKMAPKKAARTFTSVLKIDVGMIGLILLFGYFTYKIMDVEIKKDYVYYKIRTLKYANEYKKKDKGEAETDKEY